MKISLTNLDRQLAVTSRQWRPALRRMLARGQFVLGGEVSAFEREFADHMGAAHAVGVGSGTAAIELCLRAEGLHPDRNEVVLPALTSLFTAQAILAAGGRPRFADVSPETLLLDAESAAPMAGSRTAAILPVHLYGRPCGLRPLLALARRWEAVLVQDACQAHGARHEGRPLTDFGRWVCYSFYPTKNLGCLGDGGAVTTNLRNAAGRIRLLRDGGRDGGQVSRLKACHSRLDEIQACFLRVFLRKLDHWNGRRARLASLYDEALAGCPGVGLVQRGPESVNHLYVIRAEQRDRLRAWLTKRGIVTGVHYPVPLHLQPAFREFGGKAGSLPHAEQACREILSLPLNPCLDQADVLKVAESVVAFYSRKQARPKRPAIAAH